jgi:hypothetical protein
MRATIDGKKIILKDDTTNTSGKVLSGSGLTQHGEPVISDQNRRNNSDHY